MINEIRIILEFIDNDPQINIIFKNAILNKYEHDGYFNCAVFHKYTIPKEPTKDLSESLLRVHDSYKKGIPSFTLHKILSLACPYYNKTKYTSITKFIHEYIKFNAISKTIQDDYYIKQPNIKIYRIETLADYIEYFTEIEKDDKNDLFFRGHSNANYILLPSIFRTQNAYDKEQHFFNSITRLCPKDFERFRSHIDQLVEMQHYELPTRLLDITKNALVALLFACLGDNKDDAEVIVFSECKENIKYGQSHTLAILACLSSLSSSQKKDLLKEVDDYRSIEQFNKVPVVQRLLQEIKMEKPAFRDEIKPESLLDPILALPALHNNRIMRQSGAFFIAGLIPYDQAKLISKSLNNKRILEDDLKPIYIIDGESKKYIKNQLEICDLNEATIFPEIDAVARYLKKS